MQEENDRAIFRVEAGPVPGGLEPAGCVCCMPGCSSDAAGQYIKPCSSLQLAERDGQGRARIEACSGESYQDQHVYDRPARWPNDPR